MTLIGRFAILLGVVILIAPQTKVAVAKEHIASPPPEPQLAPDYPTGTLGICRLAPLAGRVAVDNSGNLLVLSDYCRSQRDQVGAEAEQFWQNFVNSANSEAIAFSHAIDRQSIVAYGTTICPFLETGGTLSDLRQLQADLNLPSAFEVAITLAAIHTYCPAYRSEIGR